MSISRTGRKLSLTTKLKLREAMKSRCVEGNRVNQFGEYKGGYVNKLRLNLKRILDKKEVGGSHTTIEWINLKEKYQNSCLSCLKQEPEIVLTEDHIIPISKGGKDFINNIQPLCRGCNSKKHTKIIDFRTD
jgi:5-methylcytosine-specific restriction endonuclease McrA